MSLARFVLFMAGAMTALAGTVIAQGAPRPVPADQPLQRLDPNSMTAHAQLLQKKTQGRIDVYFEGDSITRRWGATDYPDLLENWTRNFRGWNAADFGWGADRTEHILWRLANGELDGVHPKVIVLQAGTNNLGPVAAGRDGDEVVADVTRGIEAIVSVMRSKAPDATLVLMGIFPRNDRIEAMPLIERINANLSRMADGRSVRYLNINDRLADADGRLLEGMTRDGLHPTVKGYQVWADALKPILRDVLGPPAREDLAPPPTGDPSARRPGR